MAAPASGAAARSPIYGHSDETVISVMLDATYGAVNEDDPEDLAKIPLMVSAFRKQLRAIDCGDLRAATKQRLEAAIRTPEYIPTGNNGIKQQGQLCTGP